MKQASLFTLVVLLLIAPAVFAQDIDSDGVVDSLDNCPEDFNPEQENADGDGYGDACDGCSHNPMEEGDNCCCGRYTNGKTGNANCSEDGKLTLSDITAIIDHIYISKYPLCCMAAGNLNGSSDCKVTLSDIIAGIDYVYVSRTYPADCMPECEPYPY